MPRPVALAPLIAAGLLGCGTPATVTGPDRNESAGIVPGARPIHAAEARSSWARTPEPEATPLDLAPPPQAPIVIEEPGPAPPPTPEAPPRPRDLGEELRLAVGDVSSCLDVTTAAALHGTLSVSVSATALPSGTLQRASASASLPRPAIDCIRQRVESVSLTTPIEGAPRTVSTTLRYEVSAEVTTETRTRFATDGPPPGNTQAPGTVLPALGHPGPAPGAQAPGLTLPAQAPAGPAPGYVAPGHTLPARGQ